MHLPGLRKTLDAYVLKTVGPVRQDEEISAA
jgi:hypothetical protein